MGEDVSRETKSEAWAQEATQVMRAGAAELGLTVSDALTDKLHACLRELATWDIACGLMGNLSPTNAGVALALDSLLPAFLLPISPPQTLIDVGSGGGFPGIALGAALAPRWIILYERNRRKAWFLQHTLRRLKLGDTRVVVADWPQRMAQHDHNRLLLTSKAALPWKTLIDYSATHRVSSLLYLGPHTNLSSVAYYTASQGLALVSREVALPCSLGLRTYVYVTPEAEVLG